MDTDGGAMGGYCEMGSPKMARTPPSMVAMARTQANTGRLMKK
jgi:hypothetical protein